MVERREQPLGLEIREELAEKPQVVTLVDLPALAHEHRHSIAEHDMANRLVVRAVEEGFDRELRSRAMRRRKPALVNMRRATARIDARVATLFTDS